MSDAASDPDQRSDEDAREERLLAALDQAGVAYRIHRHPPVFTVEESMAHRGDLPGAHIKNMFLKDKKGGLWLVTCRDDRRVRIRDLEKILGAPKMSFGKPELLWDALQVRPGSVTPLALINDQIARRVRPVLDAQMMAGDSVNPHPLHNRATLNLGTADLARLIEDWGHAPTIVDFDALEAAADPNSTRA